jgi:hypothetical protein
MDGPSVLVDNLAMVPVANLATATCPHPPAPLANSHFETGRLAPWIVPPASLQGFLNYSIVPATLSENQSYVLRFTCSNTTYSPGPVIQYPLAIYALGTYVLELTYSVVKSAGMPPNPANDNYRLTWTTILPSILRAIMLNHTAAFLLTNLGLAP